MYKLYWSFARIQLANLNISGLLATAFWDERYLQQQRWGKSGDFFRQMCGIFRHFVEKSWIGRK